jgi:hypothetical protein
LIPDLPAVAVRTVEEVPSPPLPDAGDVGHLVDHAGRDEDAPRAEAPAASEANGEAGVDREDDVFDDLDAVPGRLRSTGREQVARRHPVARQVPLHVRGGSVPG